MKTEQTIENTVLGMAIRERMGDSLVYVNGEAFSSDDVLREVMCEVMNTETKFLFYAFTWGRSKRGWSFWQALNDLIQNMEVITKGHFVPS